MAQGRKRKEVTRSTTPQPRIQQQPNVGSSQGPQEVEVTWVLYPVCARSGPATHCVRVTSLWVIDGLIG